MQKERITSFGTLIFKDGIYFNYINDEIELTTEILQEIHEIGLELSEGKKHCVLADVSRNVTSTPQARKYAADNKYMKNHIAYAMIARSLPVVILSNFFININRPKVITRLFNNEKDAVDWLKKMSKEKI